MASGQDPVTINIVYTRGDSGRFDFTLSDENDAPIPVTGFTFEITVDPSETPADAVNNLMNVAGVVVDGPNGVFGFAPTITDSDFAPGDYFHDVQMIDGSGLKETIIKGTFVLLQDITKT